MLKPNATRLALAANTAELVAAFKARGGSIVSIETGVAKGLRKKKYTRKSASVRAAEAQQ